MEDRREREVWRTGGRGRCGGQEGEGGVENMREREVWRTGERGRTSTCVLKVILQSHAIVRATL